MKYDLIISDFDGTLGHAPDVIENCTLKAIKDFESKGGIFAIITGRMLPSIKIICDKNDLTGIVAAYQGGVIADLRTNEILFSGGIDYLLAVKLLEFLKTLKVDVVAFVDNCLYCENFPPYVKHYLDSGVKEVINVKNLIELIKEKKQSVIKINIINTEKLEDYIKENVYKIAGKDVIVNTGGKNFLEIINSSLSKGFAVKYIADYYNIPLKKVMTIGDSSNDIELIDGEWHGVAVGDSVDVLKEKAKEITVDFKDNPVEHLIKKYCL